MPCRPGHGGFHGRPRRRLGTAEARLGARRQPPDRAVLPSAAMCRLHYLYSLLPPLRTMEFRPDAGKHCRTRRRERSRVRPQLDDVPAGEGRPVGRGASSPRRGATSGGVRRSRRIGCGCSPTPPSSRRSPATPRVRAPTRPRQPHLPPKHNVSCRPVGRWPPCPCSVIPSAIRPRRGPLWRARSSWSSLAVSASRRRDVRPGGNRSACRAR